VQKPTRLDNLLDFIITSDDSISVYDPIDFNISDHLLTYFDVNFEKTKQKNKLIKYRSYNKIDWGSLLTDLSYVDVEEMPADSENALDFLSGTIVGAFDKYAPVTVQTVKTKYWGPAFSSKTKRLISIKKYHYRRRNISDFSASQVKVYTKLVSHSINKDMRDFAQHQVVHDGLWSLYNKLVPKNCNNLDLICNVDALNEFFCTVAFPNPEAFHDTSVTKKSNLPNGSLFHVESVSSSDVFIAWKQLKNTSRKTEDHLGIAKYMLEVLLPLPQMKEAILRFLNISFKTGIVPTKLKVARVIPIPKIQKPQQLGDYRPISITANLILLLEKIYLNKLECFLNQHKIISKYQFGFRRNHSTELAMIALVDKIKYQLDQKMFCVIVALDFRKAFDSVPRESLLNKLTSKYNISDFWLRSYLSDRYQYVSFNDVNSTLFQNVVGVPQGSVLGPVLFSLYINDLPDVVSHSDPGIFADDSTFCFTGNHTQMDEIRDKINSDLNEIVKWSKMNNLLLNEKKTVILMVSRYHSLDEVKSFNIKINGIQIFASDELKCLGLTIDRKLTWDSHITNIAKKCYHRIRALYVMKSYLSREYLQTLGQSLVLSLLHYMSAIWGRSTKSNLKTIEKVIRCLSRLVLSKRKYDPISKDIMLDLKWLFPSYLTDFTTLCTTYKIIHYEIPYFKDYYLPNHLMHNHCTRQKSNIYCNFSPKSKYGISTFYYNSVLLWNKLPIELKNSSSYICFKTNLKKFMLQLQATNSE